METSTPQPDPLDELLTPRDTSAGGDLFRQSLLHRTTHLLRWRRRLKHAALVAALAACYLAGILTPRLWSPAPQDAAPLANGPTLAVPTKKTPPRPHVPGPRPEKPAPDSKPKPEVPAAAAPSALALEWQAIDSKQRRAELYRRAGDRYLEEDNDVAAALRCYRGALAAGSPKDWTISVDDNWLLMVAKQEKKEKSDANNGG